MLLKRIAFIISLLASASVSAQYAYQTTEFTFATSAQQKAIAPSLAYTKMFALGRYQAFRIGYGLRLTALMASNTNYTTAPASLRGGKASVLSYFSPTLNSQIDTLLMPSAQTYAINASLNFLYAVSRKMEIGLSTDLLGITIGNRKTGNIIATETDTQGKAFDNKTMRSVPTMFNVALLGASNRGSLNTEVFARYWLSKTLGLRVGMSHQVSEYTTDKAIAFGNNRFRYEALMPFAGFSIRF